MGVAVVTNDIEVSSPLRSQRPDPDSLLFYQGTDADRVRACQRRWSSTKVEMKK
jgi:hypothetical protein